MVLNFADTTFPGLKRSISLASHPLGPLTQLTHRSVGLVTAAQFARVSLAPQTLYHDPRQDRRKALDFAAQRYDLPDQAAAGQGVLIPGHDKDRFDTANCTVRQRQLELVPKVRYVTNPAQDRSGAGFLHEFCGEALVFLCTGVGKVFEEMPRDLHPLVEAEHLALIRICSHGDDQLVEQ